MVVASHDRYLVERVTDTAYGMFGDGRLVHLPGGVDEYLGRLGGSATSAGPATSAAAATKVSADPASEVADGGMSAAEVRAAKKDLARLERQLAKLEDRIAKINEGLAEHGSDYDKIVELEAQLKAVRQEREETEMAWLELAEQVPGN